MQSVMGGVWPPPGAALEVPFASFVA
jgi:hypothetical protein